MTLADRIRRCLRVWDRVWQMCLFQWRDASGGGIFWNIERARHLFRVEASVDGHEVEICIGRGDGFECFIDAGRG